MHHVGLQRPFCFLDCSSRVAFHTSQIAMFPRSHAAAQAEISKLRRELAQRTFMPSRFGIDWGGLLQAQDRLGNAVPPVPGKRLHRVP